MMTYHDHDTAISSEAAGFSDTMVAELDRRPPQPASRPSQHQTATRADPVRRMPLVLVLEDRQEMSDALRGLCGFLNISVDRIDCDEDLLPFLQGCRPMAVVAAMDAECQDGGNVLMAVARHYPSLPVLLMTDGDPVLAGAVDAVTEVLGLTGVMQAGAWPSPGSIVEFLCRAGVRGQCLALMPV
jgi:hypothetical protein